MNIEELKIELKNLKINHKSIYNNLVSFANLMLDNNHSIHSVEFSSKSCSVYVMFQLNTIDDDFFCVRFSDHMPSANYGLTDLYYYNNCSIAENYEEVDDFIEENNLEII